MIKKRTIIKTLALFLVLTLSMGITSNAAPYTVVKGDNLWKIAKEKLGDGSRYGEIFEANRDKIKNPSKIYVGQVLVIPEGAATPEEKPASSPTVDLPTVKTTISKGEKFGSAILNITPEDFYKAGFNLGDSCNISFENGVQFFDVPFYDGYYVKTGKLLISAYPGNGVVSVNYNNMPLWDDINLREGYEITIQVNTPGKYADFMKLMKQTYSFSRDDYASDEEYCNFRALSGGSIKENFIYRGASPVDNSRGRAAYTDKLLSQKGIKAILDLADSKEDIEKYRALADYASPYATMLYEGGKMHLANMDSAYPTEAYQKKVADGLRAIMNLPGPAYIHCMEGKDRTGFVCMLLEALCGATYEEMKADYMQTYKNYYSIDSISTPEKYNAIAGLYFDDFMCYLHDTEDTSVLKDADFTKDAKNYLLKAGMTEDEISNLMKYLTE